MAAGRPRATWQQIRRLTSPLLSARTQDLAVGKLECGEAADPGLALKTEQPAGEGDDLPGRETVGVQSAGGAGSERFEHGVLHVGVSVQKDHHGLAGNAISEFRRQAMDSDRIAGGQESEDTPRHSVIAPERVSNGDEERFHLV